MSPVQDRHRTLLRVVIAALLLAIGISILARPRSEVRVAPASAASAAPPDRPSLPPTLTVSPRPRGARVTKTGVAASERGGPVGAENLGDVALAAIRADIEARRWARAREGINAFPAANPDFDAATLKAIEGLREKFGSDRREFFAQMAAVRFPETLRAHVDAKVANPDATYNDVATWLRKECTDECFTSFCHECQEVDPVVTVEEAKFWWDSRPRTDESWKPLSPSTAEGLPVVSSPGPRVVTRDSWWAWASKEQRAIECMSILVLKSGLFEVEQNRYR